MSALQPLVETFVALDDLLERVDQTWWGAVVSDSRLPLIWDANYARIEGPQPDLTLGEVLSALVPAMRANECRHEHIVMFDPDGSGALLLELGRAGHRVSWDTVMELKAPEPSDWPDHPVEEVTTFDEAFWGGQRAAMAEFDVTDAQVTEQLVRWERDLLVPFGKRWFVVRDEEGLAGFGALVRHGAAGYVDNVVTLPRARRRGVAGAIVRRVAFEGRLDGAERIFLLAEKPDPIRLYERLGFRRVGSIASSLKAAP
jgi:GNAT superfamily N-acetyltransferase